MSGKARRMGCGKQGSAAVGSRRGLRNAIRVEAAGHTPSVAFGGAFPGPRRMCSSHRPDAEERTPGTSLGSGKRNRNAPQILKKSRFGSRNGASPSPACWGRCRAEPDGWGAESRSPPSSDGGAACAMLFTSKRRAAPHPSPSSTPSPVFGGEEGAPARKPKRVLPIDRTRRRNRKRPCVGAASGTKWRHNLLKNHDLATRGRPASRRNRNAARSPAPPRRRPRSRT